MINEEERRERGRKSSVENAGIFADAAVRDLHPTDKARAYRELGDQMNKKAEVQEQENDQHGVPD